jgi:hypothetical protein
MHASASPALGCRMQRPGWRRLRSSAWPPTRWTRHPDHRMHDPRTCVSSTTRSAGDGRHSDSIDGVDCGLSVRCEVRSGGTWGGGRLVTAHESRPSLITP